MTSGKTSSRNSSTRSCAIKVWATLALPMTMRSWVALPPATSARRSRWSSVSSSPLVDPRQGSRGDEFGNRVQLGRERVVSGRPDLGEELPGLAAEEQRASVEQLAELELVAGDDLRPVTEGPSSAVETASAVGILHDPVYGHELNDDDATHLCLLGNVFRSTNGRRSRDSRRRRPAARGFAQRVGVRGVDARLAEERDAVRALDLPPAWRTRALVSGRGR